MELKRALEIFEYNKEMLTCDMSISRDPEHQDVSPDYYGKDAEDLYYAIVCIEKYIKNAIPIEWLLNYRKNNRGEITYYSIDAIDHMLNEWCKISNINMWDMIDRWEKENERLC